MGDPRYNPSMNRATETLVGSIERVTYHNADNGFAVLKIAVKGHRDLVTLVGHLAFAIAMASWVPKAARSVYNPADVGLV